MNPLGPRLLVFPIELLRRQDILSNVVEWQAPKFVHVGQRAFLVVLLLAIVALVRRPSWRAALPIVVFTAASLLGARNIVIASIVFVPGLARGLADIGTVTGRGAAHDLPADGGRARAGRPAGGRGRRRRSRVQLERLSGGGGDVGGARGAARARRAPRVTRLRRQLPRGEIRHGGQGLHRRPLRHVPRDVS